MYGALQKLVVMCHLCHWPDLAVAVAIYDDYSSGNCAWLTGRGSLLWLISTRLVASPAARSTEQRPTGRRTLMEIYVANP